VMTSARPTPWSDCVMRDESGQYSTRARHEQSMRASFVAVLIGADRHAGCS
jgi:hypothetical protein